MSRVRDVCKCRCDFFDYSWRQTDDKIVAKCVNCDAEFTKEPLFEQVSWTWEPQPPSPASKPMLAWRRPGWTR